MRLLARKTFCTPAHGSMSLVEDTYKQVTGEPWNHLIEDLWMKVGANIWAPSDLLSRESLFRKGEI